MTPSVPAPQSRSVIIIGGGIIARSCALELQKQGCQVTLIYMPDNQPASWGNAGHIATEQTEPLAQSATLLRVFKDLFPRGPIDLAWTTPHVWLPWVICFLRACLPKHVKKGRLTLKHFLADALCAWERLLHDIKRDDLLNTGGTYKLWEGKNATQKASASCQNNTSPATTSMIEPALLAEFNQTLKTPVGAGVYFGKTAHIHDMTALLNACLNTFMERGGTVKEEHVLSTHEHAEGVTIKTTHATYHADMAIIAGGVLSKKLVRTTYTPMIAERGYHIEWEHGGAWSLPNVLFEDRSLVVTRFGNRLRATSFVEFTSHEAKPDPRKWKHLIAQVHALGLPVASEFSYWHGSRPTLPDYLPAIGAFSDRKKLFAAYGHNHLGLTLAATTAERLAAHMLHDAALPPSVSPNRFRSSCTF